MEQVLSVVFRVVFDCSPRGHPHTVHVHLHGLLVVHDLTERLAVARLIVPGLSVAFVIVTVVSL